MNEGSIAWHVARILKESSNGPMHYSRIMNKLRKRKDLSGATPTATLLSVLIRNKKIFARVQRGYYKLK